MFTPMTYFHADPHSIEARNHKELPLIGSYQNSNVQSGKIQSRSYR